MKNNQPKASFKKAEILTTINQVENPLHNMESLHSNNHFSCHNHRLVFMLFSVYIKVRCCCQAWRTQLSHLKSFCIFKLMSNLLYIYIVTRGILNCYMIL